jgi:uncharacterized protein (TIGR02001 family)
MSGSATIVSDYRYRGITLSDQKPAAQLSVNYDTPFGAYAGVFVSTVRFGVPTRPGIQALTFAGWATRLQSGISIDAGVDYSAFTNDRADDYGEFYLGVAKENISARIHYSPRYFGRSGAWYGEINGTQPIIDPVRLIAHVGLLAAQSSPPYGVPASERIVDGKVGLSATIESFRLELAWVGVSKASATYPFTGSDIRNGVVLSVLREF